MNTDFKVVNHRRRKNKGKTKEFEYLFTSSESFYTNKVKIAVEEFENSQFCFTLTNSIEDCCELLGSGCIHEIICYGLGNFINSKSSLHQLAALLVIQEKYKASVCIFDPVFQELEITILESLNFIVLTENEEGKRKLKPNQITLVFFPHCPKQLTNNFLWANWNITLKNCILVCNSFTNIVTNHSEKIIKESANYISNILPKTTEIQLINNYFIDNIFNDISIHCFNDLNDNFFINNSTIEEPVYLEDTEFIRNHLSNIVIHNE